MPELPEVEGFRAFVDRHVRGRTIARARALDDWMLKDMTPGAFARRLKGRRVSATDRRGKIMIAFTAPRDGERDAPALALHFGMTGRPLVDDPATPLHPWDRMTLDLDDGTQFRYRNARRLGFIRLLPRSGLSDLLWGLGPDPLEAPASWLRDALATRRAPIKAVLLDQSLLAGIGNIYADESLHVAGIHPARPAGSLSDAEIRGLHAAIRRVLRRAVAANVGETMAPLRLRVPRAAGEPCRCGRPIQSATLGGRTGYFCDSCQK